MTRKEKLRRNAIYNFIFGTTVVLAVFGGFVMLSYFMEFIFRIMGV